MRSLLICCAGLLAAVLCGPAVAEDKAGSSAGPIPVTAAAAKTEPAASAGQAAIDEATRAIAGLLHLPPQDLAVRPLPESHLIEVVYKPGKELVYVDDSLKYIVQGSLVESKTGINVSQERREEINSVDYSALPLDKAVKIVRGNGSRQFALFEDPDCPYCKKLEHEIEKLDNVTMYLFLFPLTQLHPAALERATSIWCSEHPADAWKTYMLQGGLPEKRTCETPVREIAEVASKLGVTGTPSMVFEDGRVAAGALPMVRIESYLTKAEAHAHRVHTAAPAVASHGPGAN